MLINIISLIKNLFLFTGSVKNQVFPEPLSNEDELKYIYLMKQGDMEARNKLIEHNLRLVAHIVKNYENKNVDNDDLISIGTIGLIKGIDTYEVNDKTKITTYASRCIQNEILMYFRQNKKHNNVVSLNDSIGTDKDGNEICLIDVLKNDEPEISDNVIKSNNINLIKRYFKELNSKEQDIIQKRYGLNNRKAKTQKEIAKELKISRSYVSRIEKRALTKILRLFIKNKKI